MLIKKTLKQLPVMIILGLIIAFQFSCSSEVDMQKQQKAFYVDADGNLLNKKGDLVKKSGEFKMEGGFYVDSKGQYIQRKIDKTKEKINSKVDNTKDKLKGAASNTREAVTLAANRTTESVKANFNEIFNTKAVGTIYPLPDIKFDPESHRITNFKKEDVEGMAASLKDHPASRIQVQVYTADAKSRNENKKISNLRADVVKQMLVTLGVKEDQISSKGMGLPTEDAAKAVANAVEVVVEK